MDLSRNSRPLLALLVVSVGVFAAAFIWKWKKSPDLQGLSGSSRHGAGVGIVEIRGVITGSAATVKQIKKLAKDESVKAIVVRIDSPGGSVAPSQEIYEALKISGKPVVASMGSVAASGGYYIAMAANKVVANPGSITGSIGVIMQFVNLKKLYEWAKIERYSVKTGKFKDTGSETREMSAEERAYLQAMVDNVLSQFKKAVAENRKLAMNRVSELADGKIFSGEQAHSLGLVDDLGTFEKSVQIAAELGGIASATPKLIFPKKHSSPLKELLKDYEEDEDDSYREMGSEAVSQGFLLRILQRVLGVEVSVTSEATSRLELSPGLYWLWTGA